MPDNSNSNDLFSGYWKARRLIESENPQFPVIEGAEGHYVAALKGRASVLDFGAGNFRMKELLAKSGYEGLYHSLDVAGGATYDFRDLTEVRTNYDAILCLDVIEHMSLEQGTALVRDLTGLLNPGGVLILQTPNGRCIRNPLGWDMTHRHLYNGADLWAFLRSLELEVRAYRVVFTLPNEGIWDKIKKWAGRFIITRFLGCDYADNLAFIAFKR